LTSAEGALLKSFGFGGGKPDGTSGNPLHVVLSNAARLGNGVTSAAADVVKTGTAAGSATKGIGGFFGNLFGNLFGGHRALGGAVKAGMTYDIGEMGRERFTPSTDGTITPNNKLGNGGPVYDFSGANFSGTNAQEIQMKIREAMQSTHRQAVVDGDRLRKETAKRTPSTVRS
jgi:hypothetical protein